MQKSSLFIITLLLFSQQSFAATPEENTSRYLASITNQQQKLHDFLYHMPKGGDLHNHAVGATFAENMLNYGADDNLCVDPSTYTVSVNNKCDAANLLDTAVQNASFKDAIIDAWSMRHFQPGKESGHDHFFNTFLKFDAIASSHLGEIFAEITQRAGEQNESYIETMVTPDNDASGVLGQQLGYNEDFARMRANLLAHQFDKIITNISSSLDTAEQKQREILQCGTNQAKAGCQVKLVYQYQILREQAPEMVFAQMLAGFESASKDKRIVGLNMVQPEDGKISMRDYNLHMRMLDYLHGVYPNVNISLHAGELTSALVPQQGLTFHINAAINKGHAQRIGHGVDIASETNSAALLKQMAAQGILVEINLSSNAKILNVSGKQHPLHLYLKSGVPVALSTDDEGVNREIMTAQYMQAVTDQHIDYPTLKNMVRNSISYSFLPGANLWQDKQYQHINAACANDIPGSNKPGASCQQFLSNSEKAAMQWNLENRFQSFESKQKAL